MSYTKFSKTHPILSSIAVVLLIFLFPIIATTYYLIQAQRYYKVPDDPPRIALVFGKGNDDAVHNEKMEWAKTCVFRDVGKLVLMVVIVLPSVFGLYAIGSMTVGIYEIILERLGERRRPKSRFSIEDMNTGHPYSCLLCRRIIETTEDLVSRQAFGSTRMSPILKEPYVKQYIAGAMLSVLTHSYNDAADEEEAALKPDVMVQLLSERFGEGCKNGYSNVEAMLSAGAPFDDEYIVESICVTAEICVYKAIFLSVVPDDEFDVFRREFLHVVTELCAKNKPISALDRDAPERSGTVV